MKRLLFVLPLLAVLGFVGCEVIYDAPASDTHTEPFAVADGYKLVTVENEVGNVKVVTAQTDSIIVTYERKCWGSSTEDAEEHLVDIYVLVEGNSSTGEIKVKGEVPDKDLDMRRYQVDFTITIPDTTKLDITNITGNVEITGVRTAPTVENTTGNITLEGLECEVDARNTTGNIDCTIGSFAAGGKVTLRNTTGDVNCTIDTLPPNAEVSMSTTTDNVSLEIGVMDTTNVLDLTVVTGNADITLPADVELEFDLEVTTGNVTINDYAPVHGSTWSNIHKVGTIGDAATKSTLDATITTGNITLNASQ